MKVWNFSHQTSSPGHHEANEGAEATVKTIKTMIKKWKEEQEGQEDPYIGLKPAQHPTTRDDYKSSSAADGKEYQNNAAHSEVMPDNSSDVRRCMENR